MLLCLVNSKDLIHYIIKFGLLKFYPHFLKHYEGQIASLDADEQIQ